MPISKCRFIKRVAEFVPAHQSKNVPDNTRGIYALLNQIKPKGREQFDVVYVGMSAGKRAGMYSRLNVHKKSKRIDWTHFTIFEVHDNITSHEIKELEGLFRHMYRKDSRANKYNRQLSHKSFLEIAVPKKSLNKWNWPN
jgi:hypothetical protein